MPELVPHARGLGYNKNEDNQQEELVRLNFYEQMGGEQTIRSIVDIFYPKVLADPVIGPLFPDGIEEVKEKQFLFLSQFFGGPPLYSERFGHPMMRARHMQVPIGIEEARAWLACMRRTLEELELPKDLREAMMERLSGPAYHFMNKQDQDE